MSLNDPSWERRVADLWNSIGDYEPGDFVSKVETLAAELHAESDELDGAVRAFLALALADLGHEREALVESLTALSHYLPRYNRSLARYALDLRARDA